MQCSGYSDCNTVSFLDSFRDPAPILVSLNPSFHAHRRFSALDQSRLPLQVRIGIHAMVVLACSAQRSRRQSISWIPRVVHLIPLIVCITLDTYTSLHLP
jgi:hypothetical protein